MSQAAQLLRQGIADLGLALPQSTTERLLEYLALLAKWNRVYNLTAIREERKWVSHHLLDSLAVVPHLPAGGLVDVGSGAGLPGIPIALACPDRQVTLLDSNQKKGAFLNQSSTELALTNVKVLIERAESYRPATAFDVVISRAFSSIAEFIELAGHLCKPGGVLVAMKGARPDAEIAQLPQAWRAETIIPLRVPQLDAQRHLVMLRPRAATHAD
ncbi:MAG: 16S rRNA (guanine(527)-N(7))-methyltransferase RsmG [Betaproteobacteria bacterium]